MHDILEDSDTELKKIHTKNNPRRIYSLKWFLKSSLIIIRTCSESFQFVELFAAHFDELHVVCSLEQGYVNSLSGATRLLS